MKEENWNYIAKYLAGEMNMDEKKQFETWRNTNQENLEIYEKVKQDWDNFEQLPIDIDENKAWNNFHERLLNDGLLAKTKSIITPVYFKRFMYAAAVIIVLLVSGYFLSTNINNSSSTVIASTNYESKSVVLPDGSVVTLYANSSIEYPKTFGNSVRTVTLNGVAFFEVTKLGTVPFLVHTTNAEVKVLGTSFSVNSNPEGSNAEVFVKTGKVQLTNIQKGNNSILLLPGEMGICKNGEAIKTINNDENYLSWKTKELVFKNTGLNEVLNTLGKTYLVEFEYKNPEIQNLKVTTTFSNQPIESILKVICNTFDLRYEKQKNKVYLFSVQEN